MLAYVLAIAVAFISFAFYMAAFFFPEVHRKDDFLWSGVGLFYALVLWVCAGRITGGVLLGQLAGVALVFWLGWETLTLRRAIAHPETRTEVDESFSLTETLQTAFGKAFSLLRRQAPDPKPSLEQTEAVADISQAEPQISTSEPVLSITEKAPSATPQPAESAVITDEPAKADPTPIEDTSSLETPQSATPANKSKRAFPNFFRRRVPSPSESQSLAKNEPTPPTAPTGEAMPPEIVPSEVGETNAPQATPPQPPTAEMVEAAQAEVNQPPQIDVEEIAPEAQLTPPAEPTGDGDPQVRQELQSSLEEPDKKSDAAESP